MTIDPATTLLEQVQQASGCMYVSDLRSSKNRDRIRQAVLDIPVSDHSDKAWSSLANYVMDAACVFHTREQALDALLSYLSPAE